MKLRTSFLHMILAAAVLTTGCKKDKDNNDGDSATKTNITTSSWKISGAEASGIDIIAAGEVDECYLDNRVTFRSDLTGEVDEQTNVCDPSTAGEFTWSLNPAETEITLSTDLIRTGNNTFEIVSVSSTTLVLSQVATVDPIPFPVEITVTLTHP